MLKGERKILIVVENGKLLNEFKDVLVSKYYFKYSAKSFYLI